MHPRRHSFFKASRPPLCVALLVALASVGCVRMPWHPGPLPELRRIEGWIPYWVNGEAVAREAVQAGFTDLLLFHGTVNEHGGVSLEKPDALHGARAVAHASRVRTWLTVTNHGKSLQGALAPDRLAAHADHLMRAFRDSRCDHLDLDYESMTPQQAAQLPELARLLDARLAPAVRLAFTLQPVDVNIRPEQITMIRQLLAMPRVATIRFMMYDYAWRTSLPGALCPVAAYTRLVQTWSRDADKLTLCLPLYGYDWPRPEDTSLPRAETVVMRALPSMPAEFFWMREEGELAARSVRNGVPHMAAVPSLRAIHLRVRLALDAGVPAVAFWHLGAAELAPVVRASRRQTPPPETVRYTEIDGWNTWLVPFKQRVCRVIIGDGTPLETLARKHNLPLATVNRFNQDLRGDTRGQTLYLPVPKATKR